MTVPVDFLKLYQELNLPASATFEDIKLAYRRRVSELHPDRAEGAGSSRDAERLQLLTTLYGATASFYRRHGRLPGSAMPARVGAQPIIRARATTAVVHRRRLRGIHLLIAVLIAGVLWLSISSWQEEPGDDDAAPDQTRVADAPATPALAAVPTQPLQLGMPADDVEALEGEPITRSTERWDYGPSWIAFREDKVTDWYSSPMRPLKAATRHPSDPQAQ